MGGVFSQSSTGKLFYVFSKFYYSAGITKDIFYITSTDNGITWSSIKLYAAGPVYGSIAPLNNNKLIMVYQNQGIYSTISSDDGISWTPSVMIDSNTIVNAPRVIKDQSGKLWLFYQKYFNSAFQSTQQDVVYRTSIDSGASWSFEKSFTFFGGFDGYYSVSDNANNPFVSFASVRGDSLNLYNSLWYGKAELDVDYYAPPFMYKYIISPDAYSGHQQYILDSYIIGSNPITSVNCIIKNNVVIQPPIQMYDDGTHGDTTANDFIYTCILPEVKIGDAVATKIVITDYNHDTSKLNLK
jgi:hypothetical protein